jgi:hypothetical protein
MKIQMPSGPWPPIFPPLGGRSASAVGRTVTECAVQGACPGMATSCRRVKRDADRWRIRHPGVQIS